MVEIVDKNGQIVNASKRKADQIKDATKQAANSVPTKPLEDAAAQAQSDFENAGATIAGQVAGKVEGGIQSLTQKADAYKGQLNDAKGAVEGLISGDTSSIQNMASAQVDKAIGGLLSKFGAKVEISFTEPDEEGIVNVVSSSLSTDTSAGDKISGILSLITGLGVSPGNLQSVTALASPEGLLDAGKNLIEGKIGAFDGAQAINDLATNAITEVTNKLEADVGAAFAAARNINKTVKQITGIDSDGDFVGPGATKVSGNTVFTYSDVTSAGPTDSAEFFDGINGIKNVSSDLATTVKSAEEAKQTLEGAKKDLSALSGGKDGAEVLAATQNKTNSRKAYVRKGEEYKGIVQTRIAKGSETGIIQGLSDEVITDIRGDVKAFAPKLSDDAVNKVIKLSQGDRADISEAITILSDATDKDYNTILAFLESIDTTIETATKGTLDVQVFAEPYVIGDYQRAWKDGQDDPIFPYISSVEELQAEIRFISREFDKVTVHWTETATNKNIGSEDINEWHIKANLPGIGYHYVIRRDGALQRGRPVNIEGDIFSKSIDIVFVGGINAPTGTPNQQNFISARSLTRSQFNTFDHFCRAMYKVYPGMTIVGHSELDDTQIDPGFNVTDYVDARFDR